MADTGIIDENIHPPELHNCLPHGFSHAAFRCNIGLNRQSMCAQFTGHTFCTRSITVDHHNISAFPHKLTRHSLAETRACTGTNRGILIERTSH
jgi:hypothetical protein